MVYTSNVNLGHSLSSGCDSLSRDTRDVTPIKMATDELDLKMTEVTDVVYSFITLTFIFEMPLISRTLYASDVCHCAVPLIVCCPKGTFLRFQLPHRRT